MNRVWERTQPTIDANFLDDNAAPVIPSSIVYTVYRLDTGTVMGSSGVSVTPKQFVEIKLPIECTTLTIADRQPVVMGCLVTATFSDGTQSREQVRFVVRPVLGDL